MRLSKDFLSGWLRRTCSQLCVKFLLWTGGLCENNVITFGKTKLGVEARSTDLQTGSSNWQLSIRCVYRIQLSEWLMAVNWRSYGHRLAERESVKKFIKHGS